MTRLRWHEWIVVAAMGVLVVAVWYGVTRQLVGEYQDGTASSQAVRTTDYYQGRVYRDRLDSMERALRAYEGGP